MRSFKIFRAILAFVHLSLLLLIFFSLLFLIYVIAGGAIDYPLVFSPDNTFYSTKDLITSLSFMIFMSLGYLYLFHTLRKLAQSFEEKLFTQIQVILFKRTGNLIILLASADILLSFISSMMFEGSNSRISFSHLILSIALGCFFLVLGEIFNRGKAYKEDYELTV